MEMAFRRNEFSFRLEDHEVSIEILCNTPFAGSASGEAGWTFRHPPRDIRKRKSPATGFRPHHRQSQRKTGNPSPRCSEASLAQSFHLRRARRMVCRHQINDSFAKSLPKSFAILAAANRRGAFE